MSCVWFTWVGIQTREIEPVLIGLFVLFCFLFPEVGGVLKVLSDAW